MVCAGALPRWNVATSSCHFSAFGTCKVITGKCWTPKRVVIPFQIPCGNCSVLELTEEEQVHPALEKLPSIVVVIDEFADMMMIVGKKVEELIARIAQKARVAVSIWCWQPSAPP